MISPTSNAVALTTEEMPQEKKDSARIVQRCLSKLDVGSIVHHLEKINTDIAIAELLQNAILVHLKQEDEEKEEDEHHNYHRKMLATRKGLTQQLTAADVATWPRLP